VLVLVWDVHHPFPMLLVTSHQLLHPYFPNLLLLVQHAGAEKTYILSTLGIIKKGIILCFIPIPLLAQLVQILIKFTTANETWGNVDVKQIGGSTNRTCPQVGHNKPATSGIFCLWGFSAQG
jgi:hypothetical protein